MVRPDLLRTVDDDPDQSSAVDDEIRHLRPETDLAAHLDQPVAEIHHDLPQPVRPDVGAGVDQDVGRRPHVDHDPLDPAGVWIFDPLVSLPSEKVPAPPSPKWTWLSGFSMPFSQKERTSESRSGTALPRSRRRTGIPFAASVRAAKSPAGPQPTTTGLRSGRREACSGRPCRSFLRDVRLLRHGHPRCVPSQTRSPGDAVRQPDGQQIDKTGRAGAPRIDRPPDHPELRDRTLRKTEEGGDAGGEKVLPLAEGRELNH